jgi:hypothetical protein
MPPLPLPPPDPNGSSDLDKIRAILALLIVLELIVLLKG